LEYIFFGIFHLVFWKNRLLLEYKRNYVIFCVVRNPYERALSDFKYWIKFYNQQKNSRLSIHYFALLRQVENIYNKDFSLTKENLNRVIQKIYKTRKYEYALDGHLIPQYKLCFIQLLIKKLIKIADLCTFIFERFESDFKKFKNKYSPLITNQELKETHLNPTQSNLNVSNLSQESKELIYQYYKIDFEAFHYKK